MKKEFPLLRSVMVKAWVFLSCWPVEPHPVDLKQRASDAGRVFISWRHHDFWIGLDGVCAFTIVMGIFVLIRVYELVIVFLWKSFVYQFCYVIRSGHDFTQKPIAWLSYNVMYLWPDLIIYIHLKAGNILHEIWSISSLLMARGPTSWMVVPPISGRLFVMAMPPE